MVTDAQYVALRTGVIKLTSTVVWMWGSMNIMEGTLAGLNPEARKKIEEQQKKISDALDEIIELIGDM